MQPYEFGRQLVETGDLDPEYICLYHTDWPRKTLCDWLLAYWCYSHCGTACWIVSQSDYWQAMQYVGKSSTMPRGTPRRHFRGKRALNALQELQDVSGQSEGIVESWIARGLAYQTVSERIQRIHGFGKWASFKICDMLECLGIAEIVFDESVLTEMDPKPTEGALRIAKEQLGSVHEQPIVKAHNYLIHNLQGMTAPPKYNRPISFQETETIFCKWEGYRRDTYWIGKDLTGLRGEILNQARCKYAQELLAAGESVQLWQRKSPHD